MYNIQIIIIIITDFIIKLNASFDLLDEREELSGWGSKENSKNSRVIQRET